jgi:hypothetical protein
MDPGIRLDESRVDRPLVPGAEIHRETESFDLGAEAPEALCQLPGWIGLEEGEVEILEKTIQAVEETEGRPAAEGGTIEEARPPEPGEGRFLENFPQGTVPVQLAAGPATLDQRGWRHE